MSTQTTSLTGLLSAILLLAVGCGGEPTDDLSPVTSFDASKYLGTWYEIARLPNSFEDGLTNVTATYSPYKKGKIRVVNEGYNEKSKAWEQATGQAKLKGAKDQGLLKVTFVGGIYLFGGDYKIIELDPGYQYSLVTSSTRDTLWFLSRTPTVSPALLKKMTDLGRKLRFDVDSWIIVDQSWNAGT